MKQAEKETELNTKHSFRNSNKSFSRQRDHLVQSPILTCAGAGCLEFSWGKGTSVPLSQGRHQLPLMGFSDLRLIFSRCRSEQDLWPELGPRSLGMGLGCQTWLAQEQRTGSICWYCRANTSCLCRCSSSAGAHVLYSTGPTQAACVGPRRGLNCTASYVTFKINQRFTLQYATEQGCGSTVG